MLVLVRKENESVVIKSGDEIIKVMFLGLQHGFKARLGFEASPNVVIHRKEVFDAIQRNERLSEGEGS